MSLRYFLCLALSVLIVSSAKADDALWSMSGSITNTTNIKQPVNGTATISFKDKTCLLRVDAPLVGSGVCRVTKTDDKGFLTIESEGPAGNITFEGTAVGSDYSGHYSVAYPNYKELPQNGTFQLHMDSKPAALNFADVLEVDGFDKDGKHYNVFRERETIYVYDKDFKYANVRIILDGKQNPSIRVEDHSDGAEYIDVASNKILMIWRCDGVNGYYEKPGDGYSVLYDRFMQPTNWSSFESSGSTYYMYTRGKEVELYDKDFKYLNIHSSTTTAGKTIWLKEDKDGITEYFDANFNSLNWFSAVRDGETIYAHVQGKKVKLYDANLREIKKEHTFWRAFGEGLSAGLASYGQALQAQAAAQAQAASTQSASSSAYGYTTTYSGPTTYNTNSQQIGNFTYSNTIGSNGYSSQSTHQQIGNFGYMNGTSSLGSMSGSTQEIGNFTYGNYTTPSGQWNTTTQRIGNIEYHTMTAPDGTMHMGTSQRIGDFVYTNIQ
jgi:hypothetical protein